jgi:hypothetical protein
MTLAQRQVSDELGGLDDSALVYTGAVEPWIRAAKPVGWITARNLLEMLTVEDLSGSVGTQVVAQYG